MLNTIKSIKRILLQHVCFLQILKQPLAPQTLALLNQLLQQIKILQQLLAHQMNVPAYTANGKPNNVYLQFSLVITKTKQTIATLQVNS